MVSCKEYVKIRKEKLKEKMSTFSRKPCLCVIQIGDDIASNSYIKGKERDASEVGINFKHIHITDYEGTEPSEIIEMISKLDKDKKIDGIIIQLPIPDKFDINELQKYIRPSKDVDGFRIDSYFQSCTPKGIVDWLEFNNYKFDGKDVVVIGRSKIVGKPLVNMLIDKGATVTCCNSKTKNLKSKTLKADLVVSAIGRPKFFDESYFTFGTIVVDVGINRDRNNKLCGDVDRESIEKNIYSETMYITPVPNGVGLLTRCALLENVVKAYKMNNICL